MNPHQNSEQEVLANNCVRARLGEQYTSETRSASLQGLQLAADEPLVTADALRDKAACLCESTTTATSLSDVRTFSELGAQKQSSNHGEESLRRRKTAQPKDLLTADSLLPGAAIPQTWLLSK